MEVKHDLQVVYKKRVQGFDRGIQISRNKWKHEAASAFICFEMFGYDDQTLALVFYVLLLKLTRLSANEGKVFRHMHESRYPKNAYPDH